MFTSEQIYLMLHRRMLFLFLGDDYHDADMKKVHVIDDKGG